LKNLQIRLLLTPAALPEFADDSMGGKLIAARLNKLVQMEAYEALAALLEAVPQPARGQNWHEARLSQLLYRFDEEKICPAVEEAALKYASAFWQEKQLFCLGRAKDFARAATLVEVMREQNRIVPEWLRLMILDSANTPAPPSLKQSLRTLSPIDIALQAYSGHTLSADSLTAETRSLPTMLANHPKLAWEARLQAAEEALLFHDMTAEQWRALAEAVPFTPQEIEKVRADEPAGFSTATGRALHYRAWSTLGRKFSNELTLMLGQYAKLKKLKLAEKIYAVDIVRLDAPMPRLRAALTTNDSVQALKILRELPANTDSKENRYSPLPLATSPLWEALIVLFTQDDEQARALLQALPAPAAFTSREEPFVRHVVALVHGLGYALPESWRQFLPDTAPSEGVTEALAENRKGEAVLLILSRLGASASDATLTQALVALNILGLKAEAKALAKEAFLDRLSSF
jgi:hypothetical protein